MVRNVNFQLENANTAAYCRGTSNGTPVQNWICAAKTAASLNGENRVGDI